MFSFWRSHQMIFKKVDYFGLSEAGADIFLTQPMTDLCSVITQSEMNST